MLAHPLTNPKVTVAPCVAPRRAVPARRTAVVTVAASTFDGVPQAPPDPVLGISEAFKASTSPDKLNLGVGAYRDENLQPYVLKVVRKAQEKILEGNYNLEYLPIEGLAPFLKATVTLLFGADSAAVAEGRVATLQALSGTGSLTVGANFIAQYFPGTAIYLPKETWPNHRNIAALAGVPWKEYAYFEPETVGLDFQGMINDIQNAPEGSIIMLHGCAHNPTGIDPTKEQWAAVADVLQAKNHVAFFDVAYQGFATGDLDEDAFAPRLFVDRGIPTIVAQSYSKNLGLYGERVGALSVVCTSKDEATRVLSQLKRLARAIWSNPPTYGARIVAEVVGDEGMFDLWREEMAGMSGRIKDVRKVLYDHLVALNPDKDWSFVTSQIGMFTYTGMSPAQVANMTDKWSVFMTKDGRISLAGLNKAKAEYLARAIDDSVRNC